MKIKKYSNDFISDLPRTYEILQSGEFSVHESVVKVAIYGSHGLDKRARIDSDINLWLVVNASLIPREEKKAMDFLDSVLDETLSNWKGHNSLDLFVVFDIAGCHLKCLDKEFTSCTVNQSMTDCLGIYRSSALFRGFLNNEGCNIKEALPFCTVYAVK